MKKLAKFGLASLFLLSCNSFAVNPVPGWYGSLLLGASYTPNVDRTFTFPASINGNLVTIAGTGELQYSILGNVGISVGYRCDKCRFEGQFFYNNNPYKKLIFTGDSNQFVLTTGANSITTRRTGTTSWNLDGSTSTYAFMANGFYDFIPNNPRSNIAPYVGLGLGYAFISNSLSFTCTDNAGYNCIINAGDKTRSREKNIWSPAGQIIGGISYFLDDFTTFALDARYFSSTSKSPLFESRTQIASVNFLFNGTFDAG